MAWNVTLCLLTVVCRTTFACPLTNTGEEFCCSIKTHNPTPDEDAEDEATFQDLDRYAVSLCHRRPEGSDACERLGDKYNPALNSEPRTALTRTHARTPQTRRPLVPIDL